jgi:hypothetical protein
MDFLSGEIKTKFKPWCTPRMVLLEDPLMWTSTGIESLSKETYSKRSQLRSWHGHSMGIESFSAVLLPHCWSSSSSIVSARIGHPISSTVSTSSPLKTCVLLRSGQPHLPIPALQKEWFKGHFNRIHQHNKAQKDWNTSLDARPSNEDSSCARDIARCHALTSVFLWQIQTSNSRKKQIWGKPPETTQTEGANTVHSQYHHREFQHNKCF